MRARSALGVCAFLIIAATASADDGYAQRLDALINEYRTERGLSTLPEDDGLAQLAREHSAGMAKSARLGHEGFQSRFERSGYGMCVENVGWNYRTPQAQLDAWRRSPGHDGNLRNPRVAHMGAGEVAGYVTWIACR
jgi:uncharacterized protein YkwD